MGTLRPWALPWVTEFWDARSGIAQATATERVSSWVGKKGFATLSQGTAANQPILLPYSGTNYLWLPGVDDNYASAPDSAALSITGDIDIRINAASLDWTPSAFQMALCKSGTGASDRSYMLGLQSVGTLTLFWVQADGTSISKSSTVATGITDNTNTYFRATLDVDNGAAGNDVAFYKSTDYDPVSRTGTWVQIGTTVTTAGTTNIRDTNTSLAIGANNEIATPIQPWSGKFYRVQILNGINGTLAFDSNFSLVSEGATTFTESSSNAATVTINKTGGKPAFIVGSQKILTDGAAYFLQGTFTNNAPYFVIPVGRISTWVSGNVLFDGKTLNSFALQQITASPQMRLHDGSLDGATVSPTLGTKYVISGGQDAAGAGSLGLNLATRTSDTLSHTNMAGLTVGANGDASKFGAGIWDAFVLCNTALSTAQLNQTIICLNQYLGVF